MTKLEMATYVCLVATCLVATYTIIDKHYLRPRRTVGQLEQELVGRRLSLPGHEWRTGRPAAVLAMSTTCKYCLESMAFYQRLATQPEVGLVVVAPEAPSRVAELLGRSGIKPATIIQVPLSSVGLRLTPTLLLVDSGGRVVKAHVGKLTGSAEALVMADLKAGVL